MNRPISLRVDFIPSDSIFFLVLGGECHGIPSYLYVRHWIDETQPRQVRIYELVTEYMITTCVVVLYNRVTSVVSRLRRSRQSTTACFIVQFTLPTAPVQNGFLAKCNYEEKKKFPSTVKYFLAFLIEK